MDTIRHAMSALLQKPARMSENKPTTKLELVSRDVHAVVLGGSRVGKSNVVLRCLQRPFRDKYRETVEDVYHVSGSGSGSGSAWSVTITDCSACDGGMNFPSMRKVLIKKASAIILVFALNDPTSWESLKSLHAEIQELRSDNIPLLVVGNKSDMQQCKTVSSQAEQEAQQMGAQYAAVSARCEPDLTWMLHELLGAAGLHVPREQLAQAARPEDRRQSAPAVHGRRFSLLALLQARRRANSYQVPGSNKYQ